MRGWKGSAVAVGRALENRFDRLKFVLRRRFGRARPAEVRPYRGHGTERELYVKGRVLEARGITRSSEADTVRTNLRNMARRFLSAEIPYARVRATASSATGETSAVAEAVADEEGFFDLRFELREPLPRTTAWRPVEVEVVWPERDAGARATGGVLVPRGARFGVISDLDDTVVQSSVTNLLKMARLALLNNAHTRLPFEGVAAFYHALQKGVGDGGEFNPIFYVSSSPWNLYDLLEDFLDVHGVPAGPLFLKDWGPTTLKGHARHKLAVIRTLLQTYPELPFVLVGDSGEKDPEIYRGVVLENPGRIRAIYIRDVTTRERDAEVHAIVREVRALGVEMLLAETTAEAAEHAAANGLISPDAVHEIRAASG